MREISEVQKWTGKVNLSCNVVINSAEVLSEIIFGMQFTITNEVAIYLWSIIIIF